jgi:hypothetical protein
LILLITVLRYTEETSVLGSHEKYFYLLAVSSGAENSPLCGIQGSCCGPTMSLL